MLAVSTDCSVKSINAMAVEATAMEAWKAFVSSDGGAGERNPVGVLIFGKRLGVRSLIPI